MITEPPGLNANLKNHSPNLSVQCQRCDNRDSLYPCHLVCPTKIIYRAARTLKIMGPKNICSTKSITTMGWGFQGFTGYPEYKKMSSWILGGLKVFLEKISIKSYLSDLDEFDVFTGEAFRILDQSCRILKEIRDSRLSETHTFCTVTTI